jgi:hypothetical protein
MRPAIRSILRRGPFDLYVNSVSGSDSYGGKTTAGPLATLAAALAVAKPGMRIGVARGSTFREAVTTIPNGATVSAYGSGNKPKLLGSTAVTSAAWANVAGNEWNVASALAYAGTHIIWVAANGTETALALGTAGALTANQYDIDAGNLHVNIGREPIITDVFEVPQRVPVEIDGKSGITLQNLDIRYSNGNGISLASTAAVDGISLLACDFAFCMTDQVNAQQFGTNLLVDGCAFRDQPNSVGDAVSFHNASTNYTIKNCTFTRIGKNGVANSEKGSGTIYNNVFNGANCVIYNDGGQGGPHYITRNRSYNEKPSLSAGEPRIYVNGALNASSTVFIYNNSIAKGTGTGNERGIRVDGGTVVARNNAVSAHGGTAFSIGLYGAGGTITESNNGAGGCTTNNLTFGTTDAITISADPYTDVATGDLSPGVASPLTGAGVAVAGVTTGSPPDAGYTGAA